MFPGIEVDPHHLFRPTKILDSHGNLQDLHDPMNTIYVTSMLA